MVIGFPSFLCGLLWARMMGIRTGMTTRFLRRIFILGAPENTLANRPHPTLEFGPPQAR